MKSMRGFSIITVVFVLVVLAALGGVMAQLATTQHLGMAMAQEGRQAYYAARAGLEWGRDRLLKVNSCTTTTLIIEGFSVTVQCQAGNSVIEGNEQSTPYYLTSAATVQGGIYGTVSRTLQMSLWK